VIALLGRTFLNDRVAGHGFGQMGYESVPIQLAQCRFPGLAISNARILIYIFQTKYTEAIFSNSTQKLLWFEITKMMIAVKN